MSKLKIVLFDLQLSPNSFDLHFEFNKRLDVLHFIGMFTVGIVYISDIQEIVIDEFVFYIKE
jgi:hypothetical protein